MKKYNFNYSAINRRAAELYKACVDKFGKEAKNRATFGECMKEAINEWKEANENASFPIRELSEMDSDTLYKFLLKVAAKMPQVMRNSTKTDENGNKILYSDFRVEWMVPVKDGGKALLPWDEAIMEVANETLVVLCKGFHLENLQNIPQSLINKPYKKPLVSYVYSAAKLAVIHLDKELTDRQRYKKNEKGNNDYIGHETHASVDSMRHDELTWKDNDIQRKPMTIAAKAANPEYTAILRDTLSEIAENDEINKAIQNGIASGYTQSEIARTIGVSQGTISNRIRKMKDYYKRQEAKEEKRMVKEWLAGNEIR